MSKKISVAAVILIVCTAMVLTFSVTYSVMYQKKVQSAKNEEGAKTQSSVFDKVAFVDGLYRENFVGEIDEEAIADYLVRGYLVGTGDKYAYYLTKEEMNDMMDQTKGTMVGIGIHVTYDNTQGTVQVVSVTPQSPAEQAGILPGDYIYKVDGEAVSDLGYYSTVEKVQGEVETDVTLTILRDGTTQDFTLTRQKIDNVSVTWHMYDDRVGIVRLDLFSENTGDLVKQAVEDLRSKGATQLVFDVRNNSGGELNGIVNTLDYLLPKGPILHIQNKSGETVQEYNSDESCVDMPMAVLVNGSTASAAELFTAGLQDYKVATIVGTQTFGKGTVCTLQKLPDGSGLSYSTQYYTPPYSDSIEGVGVTPDIVIEMTDSIYSVSNENDVQLQAALNELAKTTN